MEKLRGVASPEGGQGLPGPSGGAKAGVGFGNWLPCPQTRVAAEGEGQLTVSNVTHICSGRVPNVVLPRTQLGPLGLCVKARNKDSIIKSSQAVWLMLPEAQGEPGAWLSWGRPGLLGAHGNGGLQVPKEGRARKREEGD